MVVSAAFLRLQPASKLFSRPYLGGFAPPATYPATATSASLMVLFTVVIQGDKVLRDEAIRKAYLDYGYSMAAITRHAEVHYSTVSKVIKGER